ncbi:O-antigen polymerase [Novosphingobium sp.]|uniref:O-antigen polymerase n=1 Tax=Novosphingobium sp. TaxID=1874826 RepID=UPI003BAB4FDE
MTKRIVDRQRLWLFVDPVVILLSLAFFLIIRPGFDLIVALPCLIGIYGYIAYYVLSSVEVVQGIKIRLTVEFGFVAFYYILFFLPYQQELLGIGAHYYESALVADGYAEGANKAMLLALAGIAAFHLGSILVPRSRPNTQTIVESNSAYIPFDLVLAAVLVVSFAAFIFFGLEPDDLARYQQAVNRVTEDASPVVNGLYALTILLCLIGVSRIIVQLYFRRRLQLRHWVIIAAVSFWMLYILIHGDRNNFLVVALGAVGGYAAFLREVRWPILLAAVIPALIVYNTIEIYRQASDQGWSGLEQAFTDASHRDDDESSFALTTMTVRATFDFAPDPEPYAGGYYKLVGFGGIVPLVRGIIIGKSERFTDTSQVIAYYVLGPDANWSLGSNPLSDLYLDFGPAGVAIGLALLGYVSAQTRNYIAKNGPSSPRIFLYVALLAMMSEVPRYTIDFPVRIVVWGSLVYWLYGVINPAARIATHRRRRAAVGIPAGLVSNR